VEQKKMAKSQKTIKNKDLAHQDHCDFLESLDVMAMKAYSYIMLRAMVAIRVAIGNKSRLKKSDNLKSGWSGDVPKVELDFEKIIAPVLKKYIDALKWVILGDYAGKDATEAAKALKLSDITIPGIVPAAYLSSLDTHRIYYKQLFNKDAPEIQKRMIKESLAEIQKRTEKFLNMSVSKMQNSMSESVNDMIIKMNMDRQANVHSTAYNMITDGMSPRKAFAEAVAMSASDSITAPNISSALKQAIEKHRDEWSLFEKASTSQASAVGTHQAINEVFGRESDIIRVAFVAMRDEKTCSFCKDASRRADGSFKVYSMSDFHPAGHNFSRKKKDWELCVPPSHFGCRCTLVYIPDGFDIDVSGSVVPSKRP
jgi:hypothetical protein